MAPPRFTIITVSRNAAAHIGACLKSVSRQTYAEVEHVVIDGASTDGTQNVVERLSGRVSVFVSEPDRGIYDAMNKGLSRARGDYILFLGADDYLIDENVLADVAQRLQEAPADVVYGGLEVRRGDGHISIFHPPPPAEALDFMVCGCLPHQATFAHKSVFERIGAFDTRYKIHADYDWFLRMLDAHDLKIRCIDRVVSSFALGGQSSQLRKGQHEVFAIQNAFAPYQTPGWMQRRLAAFQNEALQYRVQAEDLRQDAKTAAAAPVVPATQLLSVARDPMPPAETDPALPVHFFTIVLNGEPFIRYHLDVLKRLPFRWHWHVVEGVASLVHDTAWSVAGGGRIDASFHEQGRSNDGTSAYLDEIAAAHPGQISLYRKPLGQFWDGKLEMVSAPLASIKEPCLLWQIDADELWTRAQIEAVRAAFIAQPDATAAYFWCDYYVGPEALISTRYNYAQNPNQEWLRAWRYAPGDYWAAHEPPTLMRRTRRAPLDLGRARPILHDETEAIGAVFQHFAYATPEQAQFKEKYYGYAGAEQHWRALQRAVEAGGPLALRDYFPWVTDETLVESASRLGVAPLALVDATGVWRFGGEDAAPRRAKGLQARIVVDGVFFQHNQVSGIARVWRSLIEEWRKSGFADDLLLLDRAGTAPRLPGLRIKSIPAWDEHCTGADAFLMQKTCDEAGAELFVSSYYTSAITTPSVFVAHDFIPELLDAASDDQIWREKHLAIAHAARVICVSESTRNDLLALFPEVLPASAVAIPNAVPETFTPATHEDAAAFRQKQGVARPYFLLVGERIGYRGYKNTLQFFRAFQTWSQRDQYEIVCIGGADAIEPEIRALTSGVKIQRIAASDDELRAAYSGAAALVYPSQYEGFGLPLLEAMACACPAITTRGSSLGEVAGDAALYITPGDDRSMARALDEVIDPATRTRLIAAGLERAALFSWPNAAAGYASVLRETIDQVRSGAIARPSPVWAQMRREQQRNQADIIRALQRPGSSAREAHHRAYGLTSPIARSALRGPAFAMRGMLLRTLPVWAMPAARRAWRVLMGVKA